MATRHTDPAGQAAAAAEHVVYAFFVTLNFLSQTMRVFNGLGQITFNGQVFSGLGEVGSISQIGESTELKPESPVVLALAQVDPTTLQYALDRAEYFRRSVRIDIAFWDTNTNQIILPVEAQVWEGSMDTVTVSRSEGSASITLTCESSMAKWNRVIGLLWTDEHQRSQYPNDAGLDHIAENRTKTIVWGDAVFGPGGIPGTPSDPNRGGGQHRRPPLP